MSTDPHPELPAECDVEVHGVDVVACSPGCALPAAQRLWPAWRDLDTWRARVDAELPGDFTRLLPELWRLWHERELPEEPAAESAGPLDAAVDDRLSPEDLTLLLDDLYRAVFALGAGWAESRKRAP